MQLKWERVCGMDVHKAMVKACVRMPGSGPERQQVVKTLGTTTRDLLLMSDWLKALGVTHVAMESTGVFWKPVDYVLEGEFTVMLVNPATIKNLGAKTDVRDARWIAQLLECDLLRGSFIAPEPMRVLRSLTRYGKKISEQRVQEVQRLQDVLEDAGIKLSTVASNILGVSGRAMIEGLVKGKKDPEALAELARGSLRGKKEELRRALEGHFGATHAFLVEEILGHLDHLEAMLERLNDKINESLQRYQKEVERLQSIPGVKEKTSQVVVAELGVDMKVFPTAGHAASWGGLCPVSNESAGQRRVEHVRKRRGGLRPALTQAAWAAVREDNSYLAAQFHRLMGHTGKKKAIIAVAHSILVIAYHVLKEQKPYHELGADYFFKQNRQAVQRRCIRQLELLGFQVTVKVAEEAAHPNT